MPRDLDFTFARAIDRYAALFSSHERVTIGRRTSSLKGRVHVAQYEGVVCSLRSRDGCIYLGVGDREVCVYDTSDAYAETIVHATPSTVECSLFDNCTKRLHARS